MIGMQVAVKLLEDQHLVERPEHDNNPLLRSTDDV